MKSLLLVASLLLLAAGCAQRDSMGRGGTSTGGSATTGGGSSTAQLSTEDMRFVREAAQSGLAEVRMGQLAMQNAQSEALRSYGQRLVADHTRANEELAQLALQKGAPVPMEMDASDRRMIERLSALSGAEFDRMSQRDAVQAHERDIKLFQRAAQNCKDPELRAFAQKTLPILQEHLAMAQQMSSSATTGAGSTSSGQQ